MVDKVFGGCVFNCGGKEGGGSCSGEEEWREKEKEGTRGEARDWDGGSDEG